MNTQLHAAWLGHEVRQIWSYVFIVVSVDRSKPIEAFTTLGEAMKEYEDRCYETRNEREYK